MASSSVWFVLTLLMCALHIKLIFSPTYIHQAQQPVSVPMPPRKTSSVITKDRNTRCEYSKVIWPYAMPSVITTRAKTHASQHTRLQFATTKEKKKEEKRKKEKL